MRGERRKRRTAGRGGRGGKGIKEHSFDGAKLNIVSHYLKGAAEAAGLSLSLSLCDFMLHIFTLTYRVHDESSRLKGAKVHILRETLLCCLDYLKRCKYDILKHHLIITYKFTRI